MKFKTGDKVRVKSWEQLVNEFGLDKYGNIDTTPCVNSEMKDYCDTVVTINECYSSIKSSCNCYRVYESIWEFSDDMLIPATSKVKVKKLSR